MKKKIIRFSTILATVLFMAVSLVGCGGGGSDNPFLGSWDDDEGEQSFVFYEDGTGAQTSYYSTIAFTYTVDGDVATITSEEYGISADVTYEDGEILAGSYYFHKVNEAHYVMENVPTGGSEDILNGYYTDAEGICQIYFDGAGTFGYSNNDLGIAGSGTYTYDGMTLVVTIYQDDEEVSYEGSVRDEDYAVYLSLWDDSNIYYAD